MTILTKPSFVAKPDVEAASVPVENAPVLEQVNFSTFSCFSLNNNFFLFFGILLSM